MKKLLKFAIKLLPVVIMIAIVVMPTVLGAGSGVFTPADTIGNNATSTFTQSAVTRIWDVTRTVLQIAAVAALLFSGVRYMFASADAKADIKKSVGILVVGALLVFGSTIIVQIIINIAQDIAGKTVTP